MSVILMTTLFYKALILQGEIWCWSRLRWYVTRDDLQRRFTAQHSIAMLEQCCNHSKQCCNNTVMLCCAENRHRESSRVTSPRFLRKVRCCHKAITVSDKGYMPETQGRPHMCFSYCLRGKIVEWCLILNCHCTFSGIELSNDSNYSLGYAHKTRLWYLSKFFFDEYSGNFKRFRSSWPLV